MGALPLLLTLGSALLYTLSFPPFSWYPLAWVALVPFFLAASMVRPGSAAIYGILWGVAMACGVAWCLPEMLVKYFKVSTAVSLAGFFAISIGLAGVYFGAFAAWLSWLAHRQAAGSLLLAAGWGACEFARANLLIGNPWALSGYSQVAWTQIIQIADATGTYGVGILIAAVNACLAGFFTPALRGRRPILSCTGVVAACFVALVYGQWRLSQPFATGEPIKVAVIQGAIERQNGRNPGHREARLQRYLALTKEAAAAHPTLIFWPESAVDFPLRNPSPQREAVLRVTLDLKADLILGGPYYSHSFTATHSYNSVFLVRGGELAGRYDKLLLFPIAEGGQLEWLLPPKKPRYTPGRDLRLLHARAARVGALVCFEAMYPELARRFARQGAQILANPSNDDWFGYAAAAQHQLDIASLRAIENRRYLVRPTATGFSAVIDPYGRAVALSGFGGPEVLGASIYPLQMQTLYQLWGDAAVWLAIAFATVASLCHMYWSRKKPD